MEQKEKTATDGEVSQYLQANFAQPVLQGAQEENGSRGKEDGKQVSERDTCSLYRKAVRKETDEGDVLSPP